MSNSSATLLACFGERNTSNAWIWFIQAGPSPRLHTSCETYFTYFTSAFLSRNEHVCVYKADRKCHSMAALLVKLLLVLSCPAPVLQPSPTCHTLEKPLVVSHLLVFFKTFRGIRKSAEAEVVGMETLQGSTVSCSLTWGSEEITTLRNGNIVRRHTLLSYFCQPGYSDLTGALCICHKWPR